MLKSLEMFAIAHSDYILIFFIIHAAGHLYFSLS